MSNIELMRSRIMEIADPNNPYTQEDFDKEFSAGQTISPDDFKIKFSFNNLSSNPNPEYATDGASGFDIRASLENDLIIKAKQRGIIPTGLYFDIPPHFEIQIRPRSGLAAKNGITVLNSPGTIDSDYRGEIKIILVNHSDDDFSISNGDRIAQGVIASVIGNNVISLVQTNNEFSSTNRGTNGFGSTGIK